MSTDFFRKYLDILNEAETTGRLVANQPVIAGQPLSPLQMAVVDFTRKMGNNIPADVQQAYDLAVKAGIKPKAKTATGSQTDTTTKSSGAAAGQPPADFTPTHFHKNNLGAKIPLMQTPDGSFWWETTATSDDGGAVQRGGARKSIQPWIGDTENRSSGLSGKSSVDGVFKNGEPVEFPEGMSWKEYAASAAKSPQAALPAPRNVKEIPHINPGELVAPNTTVALPSSGTFSNDQALANLAAQMKDGSGKKDAEDIAAGGTKIDRQTQTVDKETVVSGDSHCAQCGTPKSIHAPLKHEFVPGDDVRPESVGKSTPSSDRPVAPTIKAPSVTPGGVAKRGGVSTTPLPAPAVPPKSAPSKPGFFKEDIDQLPVADQMRSWQRLMEADPTSAQQAANKAGLGRPGSIGVKDKPDTRSLADKARDADRLRFSTNPDIDRQVAAPKSATQVPGFNQSVSPNSPLGRAQAQAAVNVPPAPTAPATGWKAKAELGLKNLAKPLNAAYAVYEGWQQIRALPKDKMSKAEYAAAITKIVAKLVEENGIFLVSSELGMLAGGAIAGVGAIPGFIAGGAAGIAAEYYFGDDISAVVNGLVDKLYGTGPAAAPQENKLNPQQIGELKQWVSEMEAWIAAGNKLDKDDQDYLNRVKAALKAAGVTVAPTPAATTAATKYKATFDKANAIVERIKNLDPKDPILEKTAWKLISELTSLYASEIGQEGANDPAVKAQMDSILAAAKAAAEQKYTEADAARQQPAAGPKEGQTGMYDGKKVIYRNGKWVYQ